VPNLRVIREDAAEPSTRAAMGRDEKRGEVPQSNDDRNEDWAKRVCDVVGDRSWENVARGKCRNRDMVPSSERLRIVLAARARGENLFPSAIGISLCQPNSRLLPHA
jgi:hypothetical protein